MSDIFDDLEEQGLDIEYFLERALDDYSEKYGYLRLKDKMINYLNINFGVRHVISKKNG